MPFQPATTETMTALNFAAEAHNGQYRKFNNEPYIVHPIRVARRVLAFKETSNPDLLQNAALLHDAVEDTEVTRERIARRFGWQVAAIVDELTNNDDKIQELGKAEYMARKVINMSSYALVVKLADRLDNVSDLPTAPKPFADKYARETKYMLWRLRESRTLTPTQEKLASSIFYHTKFY